jgi:hypothetical protein
LAAVQPKACNIGHTENHAASDRKTGRNEPVFPTSFSIPKPCVFGILKPAALRSA